MVQARSVERMLLNDDPNLQTEIVGITTTGDRSARIPSQPLSGKGDFLKELESALLADEADMAVHSMKDVPFILPPALRIRSIGLREDPRDVLIGISSLLKLDASARIGTSSTRRQALLRHEANKTNVAPIRGNIDTRLRRLQEGEFDAIVLAAAGLNRLGLQQYVGCFLEPSIYVPPAGQGLLAVEYRENDSRVEEVLARIEDHETATVASVERAVVASIEADCTTPIGVHCQSRDGEYRVNAVVLDPQGQHSIRAQLTGGDPDSLATRAADQLLSMGARDLFQTQ